MTGRELEHGVRYVTVRLRTRTGLPRPFGAEAVEALKAHRIVTEGSAAARPAFTEVELVREDLGYQHDLREQGKLRAQGPGAC